MEKEVFKKHMAFLSTYFAIELKPEIYKLYWHMLKHLQDHVFENAIKNICAEFIPTSINPFPLVAHILKYCGQSANERSVLAINLLKKALRHGPYESVNFNDDALHYVVDSNGGWPVMCNWSGKQWDINEGRLIETYKSAYLSGKTGPEHMSGISEANNGVFRIFSMSIDSNETKEIVCKRSENVKKIENSGELQRISDCFGVK